MDGLTAIRRGLAPDTGETAHLHRVLTIRRTSGLSASDLLAEIELARDQFILIPMAHVYRDPGVPAPAAAGRIGVLLAEDIWVPHIEAWARAAIELLIQNASYAVLDVPEHPPAKQALQARLVAIEGLYPAWIRTEGQVNPSELLAQHAPRLTALAAAGQIEQALSELSGLDIEEEYKKQWGVQLLSRGNAPERTRHALLAYVGTDPRLPPELAVRLARIAQNLGEPEIAMRLFAQGLDLIADQPLLEATLLSVSHNEEPELEERVYKRLLALFPQSPELMAYRHRLLMKLCIPSDYTHATEMTSRIAFVGFEAQLADAFSPPTPQSVRELLDNLDALSVDDRDLALLCCATFADAQHWKYEAIKMATGISATGAYYRRACRTVIQSLKRIFLEEAISPGQDEALTEALSFAWHYVAAYPKDGYTREALAGALSVDASGSWGLPLMVSEVMALAISDVRVKPAVDSDVPEAPVPELERFAERAFIWLQTQGALDVGFARFPPEVIDGDPTALLNALGRMIRFFAHSKDPGDLSNAERFSFIAVSLALEVPDTHIDIGALRMVASRFALAGQSQRARDIAEQILQIAGPLPSRKRLAWGAFADIYQRARSPMDALVGLGCAFDLAQEMEPEDLWWENYTLFRIVRDLNLTPFAWALLPVLQGLHASLPEPDQNDIQLESLALGLRVMDQSARDIPALIQLVQDTLEHYETLQDRADEVLPSIALLAQSIALLEGAGQSAQPDAQRALAAALAGLGPRDAQYIRSVATTHPTIEEAVELYNRVEVARYADDVPGDLIASELAARRVLNASSRELSAGDAAAAIELLADHSLDPLTDKRVLTPQWPLDFCEAIRPRDGAVVMLGLATEGALICLSVSQEDTTVCQVPGTGGSYRRQLARWSDKYPKGYGEIDRAHGNNEFFLSMESVNFPLPLAERVLVVAEPDLQQLPLNLISNTGELAGRTQAFGYVPSLTWLDATRRRERVAVGQRVAWISEPDPGVQNSALNAVFQRTSGTLGEHGFELDTGAEIPQALAGAEIAVVAAHGSVGVGGRFLRRVADEAGLLVAPQTLTYGLAGTELVILFICSGGRTEPHPYANASVGLTKQLLAAGCRTVIASPWPLYPSITGPWFEAFMREWDAGQSALDATFIANQAVENNFGLVPQYSLAMTVSGDPMLTKQ